MNRCRSLQAARCLAAVWVAGVPLLGAWGCGSAQFAYWSDDTPRTRGIAEVDRLAASRSRFASGFAVLPASDKVAVMAPAPESPGDVMPPARLVVHQDTRPAARDVQRIVIYNAGFRIVVKAIDEAIAQTGLIAGEFGGYVQSIRGDRVTIRVPVENYRPAVARVQALGRVVHRELEAADVTEEYVDLNARLRNAMAVRDRLNALLAKAEDVKAALEVEKELRRINEEIERLTAKLELIKNRVAHSTITATFERVERAPVTRQMRSLPFRWLRELDPNRLLAGE